MQAIPSISLAQMQDIKTALAPVFDAILDALSDVVRDKPLFQSIPVAGIPNLFLQDLENLNLSVSDLFTVLEMKATVSLQIILYAG